MQRELAHKYGVSASMVNIITKGLEQKTKQLVDKKVEVNQLSDGLSKQELNAVDIVVEFKTKFKRDVQTFSNFKRRAGQGFKAIVERDDLRTLTQDSLLWHGNTSFFVLELLASVAGVF